jgi:aspartate-semialdehyde dehydrogenase
MRVAVLGATGAVGRTMLRVLEERGVAVDDLLPLASPSSAGRRLSFAGREWEVRAPREGCFTGVDYALFSAGAERSREWGPRAAAEGATVIDNSSAWRMDPQVPLVVPEVNAAAAADRPLGIIANPNCSTIQLVVALAPLQAAAGLTRVTLTTFQSVSGAGESGRDALRSELAGEAADASPFTRGIAGDVLPQIGDFDSSGWSGEEVKMRQETRKILALPGLPVSATCVRVPVEVGHAVSVVVEMERALPRRELAEALAGAPGLRFAGVDAEFSTPRQAAGSDDVSVSRLRVDPDDPRRVHLWVVADNLRKGAATNAVQILEVLHGQR